MKEADMYPAVKSWLERRGFTVYPEVPMQNRAVDVIGINPERVVGVEMKLSLTQDVIHQAVLLDADCNESWIAVTTRPRKLEKATRYRLGVLRVSDKGVEVLAHAPEGNPVGFSQRELRLKCSVLSTKGVAGVPNLEGVGPAQDCKRRVDEYRKQHPKATWRELYEKVPNHYSSHKSMMSALTYGLKMRPYWKAMRKMIKNSKRKIHK